MSNGTMNVSLSGEMLDMIESEVKSGQYMSGSEVVREALRLWINRRIEADVAALERAHAGAWERGPTPKELDAILEAKRLARARLTAEKPAKASAK
jgi:putative addiction module CopG family antidote